MQLSEFTFVFLTLCIPFLGYIVSSTSPKKGFSILFVLIIGINGFIYQNTFSLLGVFFLVFYLYLFEKEERKYFVFMSMVSFLLASFNLIGQNLLLSFLPILLVSSVFSSMMIGHWFLVDPTIERIGMKNISKFSSRLSILLAFLVFLDIYESSSLFFNSLSENLLNNIVIFLYLSSALLSFGSLKSLQEKSYTGVMASTGLSYLALIVALGASGTLILSV
jgi:hypothetical protein|tara:strand:- start:315 stop:977 length:663 start_codon:yes stop_codon:yes gene_type:complete